MKLVGFLTILILLGLGLFAVLYRPTETKAASGATAVTADLLASLPADG